MDNKKISNYELVCQEWSCRFLEMDQELLFKRIPELTSEGEYLTLYHFGVKYGIEKSTGKIREMEGTAEVSPTLRLNIYTLLGYAKEGAALTGDWVPFQELKDARPFGPAFIKGNLLPFARTFSGHTQELISACEALGGLRLPYSDAGYQLKAFECIPVRFLFWDGDEEFPAQANILFDRGVTDFIHVESTVSIATAGLIRLSGLAGLSLDGRSFQM